LSRGLGDVASPAIVRKVPLDARGVLWKWKWKWKWGGRWRWRWRWRWGMGGGGVIACCGGVVRLGMGMGGVCGGWVRGNE